MKNPHAWLGVLIAAPLCGQTQFVVRTPSPLAAVFPQEVAAADSDGDGDPELFVCANLFAGAPLRRLLRNDGSGRFTDVSGAALPPQGPGVASNGRIVAADFDGDGLADVFSSMQGGAVVWRNLGNGIFVDTGFTDSGSYSDLVAVDLDGDGDRDVAASGQSLVGAASTLFVNQGNGTFLRSSALPPVNSSAIAAADLDADGDQDLLLGTGTGVVVLRNGGGLVFVDASAAWVGTLLPGNVRDLVVGDLDGDGDRDVVVARQGVGSDGVLTNTGAAFAAGALLPTTGGNSTRVALADVDADGDLDLWRGGALGVDLLLGDGLGGFTSGAARLPVFGGQAPNPVPFDADRDGDLDLLVCEPFLGPTLLINRHRDLVPGQPVVGAPWTPTVWSQPGYAAGPHLTGLGVALVGLPQPVSLPPFGDLAIDFLTGIVFTGSTTVPGYSSPFALAIPGQPALVGLTLYVQGVVAPPTGAPGFTAAFAVVVQ